MKKHVKQHALFLILVVLVCGAVFPKGNPWGNVKKIHFYKSAQNDAKVLESLDQITSDDMDQSDEEAIANGLIQLGDHYCAKGKYKLAKAFYEKVIGFSPNYWYLYNRLEKINRESGSYLISFKYVFKQLMLMLKTFSTSFILVNSFLNTLFYAALFVLFVFAVILFIKYFQLAGNDLMVSSSNGGLDKKRLILVLLALLWPLLILSGWMIYPFIIIGFLWLYLSDNEKTTVWYLLVVVAVCSLLYSVNLVMEKSVKEQKFKVVRDVYNGRLFDAKGYDKFDNQLKVVQALSYYQNNVYDKALGILISTGDQYKSSLKFDLMGNIYFRSEDYSESIKYFNQSLHLDEKNELALNNFTLALLKNGEEEVFKSYVNRYPKIDRIKQDVHKLEEVNLLPVSHLWKRVVNFSGENFGFGGFFKHVIVEFFKLPILYFILLFILYIFGLHKLFPVAGESTYCSKCSKMIKEASVHKSYKLCDECYQLFLIKDVIFLEAKILKEKELGKKFRKKYLVALIFSLFIPGLNLSFKEKNRLFVLLAMVFYFLVGFSLIGSMVFNGVFLTAPIILNAVGMLAFIVYFLINLFSVLGDYDGF